MEITTKKYVKKPLYVEAVRISRTNFSEMVKWCDGQVQTERLDHPEYPGKRYIKIQTHNPINQRQTKAFVGDWVLKTDRGYKIYTHNAFFESFDVVNVFADRSYPYEEGDVTVIGPECFVQRDGSVLSWKGINYVPQDSDRRIETEISALEEEDFDSCASPARASFDPGVPQ